jgi:hypothetical protein
VCFRCSRRFYKRRKLVVGQLEEGIPFVGFIFMHCILHFTFLSFTFRIMYLNVKIMQFNMQCNIHVNRTGVFCSHLKSFVFLRISDSMWAIERVIINQLKISTD